MSNSQRSHETMEPREITIIVHSARNLQGKKKGRHKYNVIFGVGNNRYRTGVEQEPTGNPQWSEESAIEVDSPQHPLVFIVREKEDILGQVSVPLSCLPPGERRSRRKFPLQPHRKSPNPQGELVFEAWVSKYSHTVTSPDAPAPEIRVTCEAPTSPSRSNPFQALKVSLQRSPIMARRNKSAPNHSKSPLLVRRNSRSLHDLTDLKQEMTSPGTARDQPPPSGTQQNQANNNRLLVAGGELSISKRSSSSVELSVESSRPEVTGLYPAVGPVEGGTVVSVSGRNLGTCREDVVGLFVCGANCLGSLVYTSPRDLQITTKAWRACRGYVVVETQSGGKGTSLVQFTFKHLDDVDVAASTVSMTSEIDDLRRVKTPTTPEPHRKQGILARLSAPEPREKESKKVKTQTAHELAETIKANTELRAEIKILKEENTKLREQNDTLKLYVDHLVARVMEECPEALCASAASAAVALATR